LKVTEKTFGPDHPNVVKSVNNLAELYRVQGDYAGAEPLLKRALKRHEQALGETHPDVATVLDNMAALYNSMGKLDLAGKFEDRAQGIWARGR
jgi:tetratricopeptide (TPR) repeat protein